MNDDAIPGLLKGYLLRLEIARTLVDLIQAFSISADDRVFTLLIVLNQRFQIARKKFIGCVLKAR